MASLQGGCPAVIRNENRFGEDIRGKSDLLDMQWWLVDWTQRMWKIGLDSYVALCYVLINNSRIMTAHNQRKSFSIKGYKENRKQGSRIFNIPKSGYPQGSSLS